MPFVVVNVEINEPSVQCSACLLSDSACCQNRSAPKTAPPRRRNGLQIYEKYSDYRNKNDIPARNVCEPARKRRSMPVPAGQDIRQTVPAQRHAPALGGIRPLGRSCTGRTGPLPRAACFPAPAISRTAWLPATPPPSRYVSSDVHFSFSAGRFGSHHARIRRTRFGVPACVRQI